MIRFWRSCLYRFIFRIHSGSRGDGSRRFETHWGSKDGNKNISNNFFHDIDFEKRGDRVGLVRRKEEGDCGLLVFSYMDRERMNFVCSGSNMLNREPNIRRILRQESEDINAEPESITLVIDQPKSCELYYTCYDMVDRHSRCRQADLKVERKLVTQDWVKRINSSLLLVCIVDSWLAYSEILGSIYQNKVYGYLAEELIGNTYDDKSGRSR